METVTIGIMALEEGLQEIPVSLGSFLEISVQKEVLQQGHLVLCTDMYPLVTVVVLVVVL